MIGLVFTGTFFYLDGGWESFKFMQGKMESLSVNYAKVIIAYFSVVLILSLSQEPFFPESLSTAVFLALFVVVESALRSLSSSLNWSYSLNNDPSIWRSKIFMWVSFAIPFLVLPVLYVYYETPALSFTLPSFPDGIYAAWIVFFSMIFGYVYLIQFLLVPFVVHKHERDESSRLNKMDAQKGDPPSQDTWDKDRRLYARNILRDSLADHGISVEYKDVSSSLISKPLLSRPMNVSELGDAMIHIQIQDEWSSDKELLNHSSEVAYDVASLAYQSYPDLAGVEVRIWRKYQLPERDTLSEDLILKLRWDGLDMNELSKRSLSPEKIRKSSSDILFSEGLFPDEFIGDN